MIQQPTPTDVIEIAIRSQYLANAAIRAANFYPAKPIDLRLPRLLYIERKGLQWMLNNNPNNPNLVNVANYVLSLCGVYAAQSERIIGNLSRNPPVVTGPSNQSVSAGSNAVFSVSIVSSLPAFYQWYRNGVLILGAINSSYTLSNAQLSDSGSTFSVKVSNAAGSVMSNVATLTVTATLLAYAYAGGTDYSTQLKSGTDNVPYQFSFPVVLGQSLIAQFPGTVASEYVVIKYPNIWGIAHNYSNPPIDSGIIPNIAMDDASITTFNYVFSRTDNPFTINSSNALTLTT